MNKTKLIIWGLLTFFVLFALGMVGKISYSRSHSHTENVESDFTPEQKAVLSALRTARADLEKSKAEFAQLINDAKATAIAKNLDPNVPTTWLTMSGGSVSCGDKFVLMGFREDGVLVWKRP